VNFEFDDDQELLRATVGRFLDERAPLHWVRARLEDPVGTTPEVHAGLAALGVFGLAVPERHGGAGGGMVDLAVVVEEAGRRLYPGPLRSVAVGGAGLLALAADETHAGRWLPDLAEGRVRAVPALPVTGPAPAGRDAGVRATPRAGGWRLEGHVPVVPDAVGADLLLVAATRPDATVGVFALAPGSEGVRVDPLAGVDGTTKTARLTCTGAPAAPCSDRDVTDAVEAVADRMAVADVLDGLGAAQAALALAVGHAKVRHQFGRPIGSFQAVAHLAADMLRAVEVARVAAYYAAWAADAAPAAERRRAATMALAAATDGLYRVGADAIQILGGIGFTWEHDAHLFYKRLLTLQQHPRGGRLVQLEALAELALAEALAEAPA
jgi:alkylation response protein AidB-like acyl-CoA dehydrogenase